jgi:DNA-binding transcriptional ArsR family regulator
MYSDEPVNLDAIEINITASMVCSNLNRICILYLLRKCDGNSMQAEKIASFLGISHRTVLYHLDILKDYGLVEVREFRKKGSKLLRSVWGLDSENPENMKKIMSCLEKRFQMREFEEILRDSRVPCERN